MYRAITQIQQVFDDKKIRYNCSSNGDAQAIHVGTAIENGPSINVLYISRSDDNDVAIRVFGLISHIEKTRKMQILNALNQCNSKYRFFKFYIDSDNDINVEYDFLTEATNIGPMALEALVRISAILNEAYPIITKALYL